MAHKVKRNTITCRCPAYDFPHRQGGGKCEMPSTCESLLCVNDNLYDCEQFDDCWFTNLDNSYGPREEALTVEERNKSLCQN